MCGSYNDIVSIVKHELFLSDENCYIHTLHTHTATPPKKKRDALIGVHKLHGRMHPD